MSLLIGQLLGRDIMTKQTEFKREEGLKISSYYLKSTRLLLLLAAVVGRIGAGTIAVAAMANTLLCLLYILAIAVAIDQRRRSPTVCIAIAASRIGVILARRTGYHWSTIETENEREKSNPLIS